MIENQGVVSPFYAIRSLWLNAKRGCMTSTAAVRPYLIINH